MKRKELAGRSAGLGRKLNPFLLSYLICLTLFWSLISITNGFNIDLQSVITHRGPSDSMFGFSVAQHRDSNVSWILVGAPEADSRQPGVEKAGAVFRCSCETNDNCQLIPFDRTGNNMVTNQQIDEKSGQWFGATVRSSGDDGIILACAPRYTWFTSNRKRKDPVGTCYVAKDSFTEFIEYSPCRTSKWGYHRQGSCQVGLGADVDPAGRRIFVGAVGSWYWQGQLYMIDSKKAAPSGSGQGGSSAARSPFYQFVPPGQPSGASLKPDIRSTLEGPSWDDDSYLGYSVISGEFNGDNDMDVAVGMPRGANLTGKVVVYSSDLVNIHNITGEQIGAYFGYALCVLDLDGDGLDDIVIGAPMYTDFQDSAMKIETGRVYIVYQNKKHKFKRWNSLDGTAHRGRFGTSLTSLGDINRDTYPDFAVGAPYDGLGRGAVFIYHGSADGVRHEHSQVIYGSSLQHPVSTFGFSLSGGKDLDGNGYPDLIVGAYDSNIVTYFRSRPVVQVRSKLTFTSGKQINLEEKRCTLGDGTRVACLPLSLCMSYDGFGTDELIDFNVQYILDSKKGKEPRMYFLNREGASTDNVTIPLRKGAEHCTNAQVYIRPNIRDKLTSFEAELRYSMVESQRRVTRSLPPVIDTTASTTERDTVSIRKNCGSDNICEPDLRLTVTQSDKSFVMGSAERVWIGLEVYNNGEDSFESTLYVQVPQGLSYVSLDRLDTRKELPILCSPPTTNSTMKCDIGNPLPAFATAKFKLLFQPKYGTEVKSAYEFHVSVNSTNPENDHRTNDNIGKAIMPIRVLTKIEVYGSSKPSPVLHNISYYAGLQQVNESTLGPEVIHVYEVKCGGPSSIEEASVVILWPSFTTDGAHLLYLLEQPIIEGPAQCEAIDVNPLGIKLQRNTKFTSYSSRSEFEDGEGRRRNFTYSSEYSSESGGRHTQTYRNSSYETSSRGGGGFNKVGGSSSSSRNSLNYGGRIPDSEETSYRAGTSTGYGSTSTSGRIPDTQETSYRAGTNYGSSSSGGRISDTQETSYRGGASYGSSGRTPDIHETSYRGSTNYGSSSSNSRIPDTEETSYRGGATYGSSGSRGIGNGRIHDTEETSYRGGATYGSNSRGSGNGRIHDTEETSNRAGTTSGSSRGSSNGRIPDAEDTSYRAGTNYGSRTYTTTGGKQDAEETSYRGGNSQAGSSDRSHGSQSSSGSSRSSHTTTTHGGGRSQDISGESSYRGSGSIRGETNYRGGGSGGGERVYHTETSYRGGSSSLSGGGFIPQGGDYSLEETHLGALNYGGGAHEGSYGRSGERTFTSTSHNGRVSFDNRPVENTLTRSRRAADIQNEYERELNECGDSRCVRIHCKIGQLAPNASVIFYLRARVYSETLQQKYAGKDVEISSKLLARVTELPYNVNPDFLSFKKLEVVTSVEEIQDLGVAAPTPWYIYLIGIILGILLLLLLIFLLYKCGFFKRRRPNPTPEGQPLHRNGR